MQNVAVSLFNTGTYKKTIYWCNITSYKYNSSPDFFNLFTLCSFCSKKTMCEILDKSST